MRTVSDMTIGWPRIYSPRYIIRPFSFGFGLFGGFFWVWAWFGIVGTLAAYSIGMNNELTKGNTMTLAAKEKQIAQLTRRSNERMDDIGSPLFHFGSRAKQQQTERRLAACDAKLEKVLESMTNEELDSSTAFCDLCRDVESVENGEG